MTSRTQSPPAARELEHPALGEIRLEGVLHALSDSVRLRIVRSLATAEEELPCSGFELPVSKSTTTHHFRVLRESGVISQSYRGTAKMSELRRGDLETLFPGLLDAVLTAAARQEGRDRGRPETDRRRPRSDGAVSDGPGRRD